MRRIPLLCTIPCGAGRKRLVEWRCLLASAHRHGLRAATSNPVRAIVCRAARGQMTTSQLCCRVRVSAGTQHERAEDVGAVDDGGSCDAEQSRRLGECRHEQRSCPGWRSGPGDPHVGRVLAARRGWVDRLAHLMVCARAGHVVGSGSAAISAAAGAGAGWLCRSGCGRAVSSDRRRCQRGRRRGSIGGASRSARR